MTAQEKTPVVICLGSSCFARGNNANLPLLQGYLQEHGLQDQVELRGSRCEGHCLTGPNLKIGQDLVGNVREETLGGILGSRLS